MKTAERYKLMKEFGLTTQYLARVFKKDVRSIRRAIDGTTWRPEWVEECRKFIADHIEDVSYEQLWAEDNIVVPQPEVD